MTLLFFILLTAVCFDLETFRIPNGLILVGYGGGILYQIFRPGEFLLFEFFEYMLCAFTILILLIPLFKIKVIGGGDVKLFSVCGMFTGFKAAISIILFAFIIAALISILYLVYRRFFPDKKHANVIHFSIPVLLGTVAHYLLGGIIWQF